MGTFLQSNDGSGQRAQAGHGSGGGHCKILPWPNGGGIKTVLVLDGPLPIPPILPTGGQAADAAANSLQLGPETSLLQVTESEQ